jgi:hypothetical protein
MTPNKAYDRHEHHLRINVVFGRIPRRTAMNKRRCSYWKNEGYRLQKLDIQRFLNTIPKPNV